MKWWKKKNTKLKRNIKSHKPFALSLSSQNNNNNNKILWCVLVSFNSVYVKCGSVEYEFGVRELDNIKIAVSPHRVQMSKCQIAYDV